MPAPMLIAALVAVAGCSEKVERAAPPRVATQVPIPQESSIISVPIEADQRAILRAAEDAVPRTLWTIDKKEKRCIPPQKVKLFGKKVNVTPAIGCTIVGVVTRGPLRLRGEGRDLIADVPISATISARDVAGILKGETATGRAMAHARIRLDLTPDWRPVGTARLSYDWITPPGIDFLGQRITFTDKADEKLAPVVRKLEQTLPRELAKMNLRRQAEAAWSKSFTVLELNKRNPPVWMRVTPQRFFYGGYSIGGGRVHLNLGLEALTQTFVGPKPMAAAVTPLPNLIKRRTDGAFRFFLPVVADYASLEPVILKALTKRSARPFILPGIGAVDARFEKITAYGTTGGRIAVGAMVVATPRAAGVGTTRGEIWFAAKPVNRPGSSRVAFENLTVTGDTDGVGGELLLRLGNSPGVSGMIATSLTQNFDKDLNELLAKVRHAIERKPVGDFTIAAQVRDVETGTIGAYGQGLYLPVRATGVADVSYKPGR